MAVMTKMRENMPVVLWILVLCFLGLIVLEWGANIGGGAGGRGDAVGRVNGEVITQAEYSDMVNRYFANYRQQSNGQEPDDATREQLRDQAWNALVEQKLVEQEARRLGLGATDPEIQQMVFGDEPDPMIRQYFTDSTGTFRRDAMIESARSNEPQIRAGWRQIDEALRTSLVSRKLGNIVGALASVSDAEVKARFHEQNARARGEYAFFDVSNLTDTTKFKPTDAEMAAYYTAHKAQYEREASRTARFVLFPKAAGQADSNEAVSELNRLKPQLESASDLKAFVTAHGDPQVPYTDTFVKHGDVAPELDPVFTAAPGAILGPIPAANGYHLVRVVEARDGTDPVVKARHILIRPSGTDTAAAVRTADSLITILRGGANFADVARKNSQDPGSAVNGGDLGWFGKGRMVPAFEKAALNAPVNAIVGPVKTSFGVHIIQVTERSNREVKLADIVKPIKATPNSLRRQSRAAQDFQYFAKDNGFEAEAKKGKLEIREAIGIDRTQAYIAGLGVNHKIAEWAFTASPGDLSPMFETPEGYAVFELTRVREKGTPPISELTDDERKQLRATVEREKKLNQALEVMKTVRTKVGQNLLAARNEPMVKADTTGAFALGGFIPGLGREPKITGLATSMKPGEISPAFKGTRGAYLFRVIEQLPADTTQLTVQRAAIRRQMLNEKQQQIQQAWQADLRKRADIEDNRASFGI